MCKKALQRFSKEICKYPEQRYLYNKYQLRYLIWDKQHSDGGKAHSDFKQRPGSSYLFQLG